MKKIYNLMVLCLGLLLFFACDDDRDSNPTLKEPTEFVLNVPPYAANVYDLEHSLVVELTCSQPNYGIPLAVTYSVQLSLGEQFKEANEEAGTEANYTTLSTTYYETKMEVDRTEFAMALLDLWKVVSDEPFPTDPMPVYVRVKAALNNGTGVIYSNVIKLEKVLGYNVEPPLNLPETMYIIGPKGWNFPGDAIEMVPVNGTPGKFWAVVYFGENAAMKFNANPAWDGKQVPYTEGLVPEASANLAGVKGVDDGNGAQNIGVGKAGWYIVTVTSEIDGKAIKYTLEFFEPKVYLTGDPSGGYDIFDDARLFEVPADGASEFISPAFVAAGELRMCIKLEGIDWWRTEFLILGGEIVYRGNGPDQERVNVPAGQKAYLNFTEGTGYIE